MLKIKNNVTEMKNASHELIRLDVAREIISKFEDPSIETSKTERQREKRMEMIKQRSKDYEIITKG